MEVDDNDTTPIVMPIVLEEPEYSDVDETLQRRVECGSLECDFVIPDESLGDIDYLPEDLVPYTF